jgi:hypothetical protein
MRAILFTFPGLLGERLSYHNRDGRNGTNALSFISHSLKKCPRRSSAAALKARSGNAEIDVERWVATCRLLLRQRAWNTTSAAQVRLPSAVGNQAMQRLLV